MTHITLVTGGAGFAGKHLVRLLREQGEQVRSFDLAPPKHADDMQGSILDARALTAAMQNVGSVFHLAGNAQLWARDPNIFHQVNVVGTEKMLQAAMTAGVQSFVHCSSLTTLISKSTPIGPSRANESVRHNPDFMLGAYPRSKLLAEHLVEGAANKGLNAVIAMPTEPLGAGDDNITPPTQMILDFANGKTPAYIDCILNFVPVESLARGLVAARDKGTKGERYLLGGENTSMANLLALIAAHTGRTMPKAKMPYWVALAAGAIDTKLVSGITGKPPKAPLTGVRLAGRQVSFTSEKAKRDLGWCASEVEPALSSMLDWAKQTGLLL